MAEQGATAKRTIYTSPSIEYAAFPVYAQMFPLNEEHWDLLVLQMYRRNATRELNGEYHDNAKHVVSHADREHKQSTCGIVKAA